MIYFKDPEMRQAMERLLCQAEEAAAAARPVPLAIGESAAAELAQRVQEIGRRAGVSSQEALLLSLAAGCTAIEDELTRAERVCCRCQNADGEEESATGGRWLCRPCWRVVTHEGEG